MSSEEQPVPTADESSRPQDHPAETSAPESAKNPLTADLVAQSISLLARTGNGLSYAYTRLEFHAKNVSDLDLLESYPHLRYVDVSENALVNIDGLKHLEYVLSLDVHGNMLTTVPASIDRRKYLQHANFSRNRIATWSVSRWPMLSWLNLNGKSTYLKNLIAR